ncbi:MAG: hypothetical protein K6C08_00800 [Oscillospiraceae bacterium]|nr:hypothetical protein [Oscillospiraceae bacterium]
MKKTVSAILVLAILLTLSGAAFADGSMIRKLAVFELYSADGIYMDSVGNSISYSYHVPQIFAKTEAAAEINAEIEERFGTMVRKQLHSMDSGYSLWMSRVEWRAYWNGSQLFLLVISNEEGDFTDYAAYGYDFENACRLSNEMILEQRGISEQYYLENLREKVQLMFEDMYGNYSEKDRQAFGYDEMLEKTLGWLDMEQPIFIDGVGSIVTIVKIASIAGAEWYYYMATPFAYG